jgi:NADP-dependent 3-hydroxy acid dehydrogenase YdfG
MFNNVVSSARKEELKKQVATGEFTQPEDIAQLIYRLSTQSPLAMNGQTIDCNDTIWLS